MGAFRIEQEILALFPEVTLGILICKGVNNKDEEKAAYEALLREGESFATGHLPHEELTENAIIAQWREAYRRFKIKKGARCSVESLLKRAKQGNVIGSINPLVDLYNHCSLKYGVPCGGEDIDAFVGDLRLAMADGTEEFRLIGSEENEPPYPGEVVYKDDAGAVCRCFNWREAERTMLTPETQNAFLIVEAVSKEMLPVVRETLAELKTLVEKYTGADCESHIANAENPEIRW